MLPTRPDSDPDPERHGVRAAWQEPCCLVAPACPCRRVICICPPSPHGRQPVSFHVMSLTGVLVCAGCRPHCSRCKDDCNACTRALSVPICLAPSLARPSIVRQDASLFAMRQHGVLRCLPTLITHACVRSLARRCWRRLAVLSDEACGPPCPILLQRPCTDAACFCRLPDGPGRMCYTVAAVLQHCMFAHAAPTPLLAACRVLQRLVLS